MLAGLWVGRRAQRSAISTVDGRRNKTRKHMFLCVVCCFAMCVCARAMQNGNIDPH